MTGQTPHDGVPAAEAGHAATSSMDHGLIPASKELPPLTIGLIIGGGVLLIAMIVAVVLVATTTFTPTSPQAGTVSDIDSPSATEEPPLEPVNEPSPSGKLIPIDSSAEFDGLPFWSIPVLGGWDPITVDDEGVTRFSNSTIGCAFTVIQLRQEVDPASTGDEATTMNLMATLKNEVYKRSSTATESLPTTVNLPVGIAGSTSTIEFASSRIDFSTATADFASVIYARSMPRAGVYMYSHLECLRSAIDGPDSPLAQLTKQLAVVSGQ